MQNTKNKYRKKNPGQGGSAEGIVKGWEQNGFVVHLS